MDFMDSQYDRGLAIALISCSLNVVGLDVNLSRCQRVTLANIHVCRGLVGLRVVSKI